MFARNGWWLSGGLLCGLFLVAAFPASAQVTPGTAEAKADRLHDRAMTMATGSFDRSELPRIVELHGQAANLRHWKDPDAVRCLRLQGHLLDALDKTDEARAYFEDAAGVALATGDLASAANAFVDAAFLAREQERYDDAQRLLKRAYDLSRSDEVAWQDRRMVQQRINVR